MNEVIIAILMLLVFGAFAVIWGIYCFFYNLYQDRYWSHRDFLKKHPEYRLNWRGDIVKIKGWKE